MKFISFVIAYQLILFSALGQEKTLHLNTLKNNRNDFLKHVYQYSSFLPGKVYFHDGSAAIAKMNYNFLTNDINFIDLKGDTLVIADAPMISKVIIQTDTFFYFNKIFLQRIHHGPSFSLFLKHTLAFSDTEQKGAFGTYSRTRQSQSITRDPVRNERDIGIDENTVYRFTDTYYISDKFNKLYPATKKGIYSIFSKHEKQVKDFEIANGLRFNSKDDLEKLLTFVSKL